MPIPNLDKYIKILYGNNSLKEPDYFHLELSRYIWNNYFNFCWRAKANNTNKEILLNLGSGDGMYSRCFSALGFEVLSLDGAKDNIDFEKDRFPYEDKSIDFIFCKSVIEHIQNTNHFLSEINRVLTYNGTVVFLTPAWEYNYKWFYDDYTHVKPFHRKGLQDALLINGFKEVEVKYFYYFPFVWKNPILKFIPKLISLLPDSWRWKNKKETKANILIRFSKEIQLLGVARK